jgi:uncharacterized membrane protein
MGEFEKSGSVHAPASQLFDFLSDVRNLPRYFARMTSAEPAAGEAVRVEAVVPGGQHQEGEAWFRVEKATRRITWGSEGPKEYSGELRVDGDDTASTVTIRLHTDADGGDSDSDLSESISNIRRLVEAGDAPST